MVRVITFIMSLVMISASFGQTGSISGVVSNNQELVPYAKILIKNTNLKKDFVWVYLEDLSPDQMIEYGEVLPKSGQEKKWFDSLTLSLRKRLRMMEKNK